MIAKIFRFLSTVVIGTLFVGLLFGGLGFLLSGQAGFLNVIPFGATVGFFGSLLFAFARSLQALQQDTFDRTRGKNLGYGWFVKTADDKGKNGKQIP